MCLQRLYFEHNAFCSFDFCITFLLIEMYFILFVSLQLSRKVNNYRKFLQLSTYECVLNNIDKHKQIYNFKTVIMNYTLAFCILSIEMINLIYTLVSLPLVNRATQRPDVRKRMEQLSPNCTVDRHIGYYYYYPASRLSLIAVIILACTQFTLISLLTTFLKKRYYVHPIHASLIRYTVWWCIQAIILLSCCVLYLFPFISIIGPSLLLINWFHLIRESRQLGYILRARIRDIVNYEWDPVLYKKSRSAYKLYVVFSILYILSMLMLIVVVTGLFSKTFITSLALDPCIFNIIYGLNLPIELSYYAKTKISSFFHYFSFYISPIITWFWFLSVIFPFLAYVIGRCSSKIIQNRNAILQYMKAIKEMLTDYYSKYTIGSISSISDILMCIIIHVVIVATQLFIYTQIYIYPFFTYGKILIVILSDGYIHNCY